ncbi:MAG: formyltetrahydrofolate deformylase [Acidimicrobiia bacterium]
MATDPNVVMLLECRDHPGIVADVARFITDVGGNIVDAAQHTDRSHGTFFQRLEFTTDGLAFPVSELSARFAPIAERHGMRVNLRFTQWRPRTVVCVSKPLHCAGDLLTRSAIGELSLDIAAVVSNHRDVESLANAFGVPFHHVPLDGDRAAQESSFATTLAELDPELVVLARYMLVLPEWIVERYRERMINIHHSFLPAFIGANPYRQAHDRGVKIIGATAHYVTADLDEGPIIDQDVVRVTHRDDVADLTRRGRDLEVMVLARAVRAHVEHRVMVSGQRTVVFDG